MKKTLLVTALTALVASQAQADLTLYESETGSLSTFGALRLQLENYDGENEIQSNRSAIGFSGQSQLVPELEAFMRVELRYNAAYKHEIGVDEKVDGLDVHNSYLGVRGAWGSLKAGSFDSLLYTHITSYADIIENNDLRALNTEDVNSQATSVAYESNEWNGLSMALGLKHYASKDSDYGGQFDNSNFESVTSANGKEQVNFQFVVAYQATDELDFSFGVDQNNKNGRPVDGNGKLIPNVDRHKAKPIYALSGKYATDDFHLGLIVENTDKVYLTNLFGGYTYGAGDIYGVVAYKDDDKNSGADLSLGINREFGENFLIYGEVARGNNDLSDITVEKNGIHKAATVVTVGAAYTW